MTAFPSLQVLAVAALFVVPASSGPAAPRTEVRHNDPVRTVLVSGSGVDLLNTAIVHSEQPTSTGKIQHSTETVNLVGGLTGRVLYHVTSTFDFVHNTLVNTGDQVYSGTVAGSAPVLIHDDQFRFEANLATGEERGRVYLLDHIAGPKVRCELNVVGTGLNADGNPTFDYTGECIFRGQ